MDGRPSNATTRRLRRGFMTKPPTMVDVAQRAGVALKTVSRYVNGETNINPAMARKIGDAIDELGYRKNLAAAAIRPGQTSRVIGLIISDLANPYYSTLARAVEATAFQHGYLLTTASSEEDGERHDRLVDRLIEQRVDGLIVVPPRHSRRSWDDVIRPLPHIVFVDRPVEFPGAVTVLADNAGGARAGTRALVESGARRIAFLGDSMDIYTMRERHQGYASTLEEFGLGYDPSVVLTRAHSVEDAAAAADELLREEAVDAIFAANNRAAIGSLLAFQAREHRVPLVGFDDFESALLATPPVSVVAQDVVGMGARAAELLIAQLERRTEEVRSLVLPTSLILRGSEKS